MPIHSWGPLFHHPSANCFGYVMTPLGFMLGNMSEANAISQKKKKNKKKKK